MKKIVLICAMALLLFGCGNNPSVEVDKEDNTVNNPENEVVDGVYMPPVMAVRPIDKIRLHGDAQFEAGELYYLYISFSHSDFNSYAHTEEGKALLEITEDLSEKMYQQVKDDEVFWLYIWFTTFVYSPIEKVSLTANRPLCGREAGKELSDLFTLGISGFVFTMDGDLVERTKYEEYAAYTIDEWCNTGYMCPEVFVLLPQEPIILTEEIRDIIFNVSISLQNGANDTVDLKTYF